MTEKVYSTQLEIPNGMDVSLVGNTVKVRGGKGELERTFLNPRINISKEGNLILFNCKKSVKFSQRDKMAMNTYKAHIKNMFFGVDKGYTAKLKVCTGHFPMNVSVDGNNFIIKNFLGEKVPRKVAITNGVKVQVQGDIIVINGLDKEKVGQAAARIEQLTRITNRDRRIFQDGCYIISKPGDEND